MNGNSTLETALSDLGETFVPRSVIDYLGKDSPSVNGRIKDKATDFVVEEQHLPDFKCTIRTECDSESGYSETGFGNKVAVTLVKCRLSTDEAISRLGELLGKRPARDPKNIKRGEIKVSFAGNKDFKAITSQRVVIEGDIDFYDVVRACMPDEHELFRGRRIFIKDPVWVKHGLRSGQLEGNNFTINVMTPGIKAADLEAYVQKRLGKLLSQRHGNNEFLIPNAYNRQRLGRRQDLFKIGHKLITEGPEAGIKLFFTDANGNERKEAQDARNEIAEVWARAERKARSQGSTVAKQRAELREIVAILERQVTLSDNNPTRVPLHEKHNLIWEIEIARKLADTQDYEKTMRALYKRFSMWIGAYQAFWFNQVLGKVLTGEIVLDGDQQANERMIPLYMDNPKSEKFYRRYCPEAIPETVNPDIKRIFLNTLVHGKDRRTGKPTTYHRKPAPRELFIAVQNFECECVDGKATLKFMLRSGSYATTLLDILFNIKKPGS